MASYEPQPQMIVLKEDYRGIPKGTKGTIVLEYPLVPSGNYYEVEFIIGGKSVVETVHENDFSLWNNIIF